MLISSPNSKGRTTGNIFRTVFLPKLTLTKAFPFVVILFPPRLEIWENPWFLPLVLPPARLQESVFFHRLCICPRVRGCIFWRWSQKCLPSHMLFFSVTLTLLLLGGRVYVPSPWSGWNFVTALTIKIWQKWHYVTSGIGHKHAMHVPLALLEPSHHAVRKL